ncbi:hypothetical protein Salat_2617400 [Sesamum alatum]|uniref:Uncharacterized protein n=1 Tax=Sesamum alatum TaxID=300844 RepID=A0AAE1XNE6_9LAMI|nr:hypothetical protein Salat_2617400 [Sesamum alatum]
MALMPILRPSWLASVGVPDYDGHGREVRVYLDAVRDPKTIAEIEGEGKEEPVHKEEEGRDDEEDDWVDWGRENEDMIENAEWVADSEDDLYDGEDNVDYAEDDECFDANIDKDA